MYKIKFKNINERQNLTINKIRWVASMINTCT